MYIDYADIPLYQNLFLDYTHEYEKVSTFFSKDSELFFNDPHDIIHNTPGQVRAPGSHIQNRCHQATFWLSQGKL